MPRGKALRNPNGYGSVVKLSGKRRKPFEVRVNTRMDERYYPVYDVLGRFETRETALIALAEYNRKPYSITDRNMTFSQLYERFYQAKYEISGRTYSQSTISCTKAAYRHCEPFPMPNCVQTISGPFSQSRTAMGSPSPTPRRNM